MATPSRTLKVQLVTDVGDIKKDVASVSKSFSGLADDLRKKGGLKGALKEGFGLGAGFSAFNAVTKGIGMVTDFLGDATEAASDLSETQSKLTAVFPKQAMAIRAWASSAASSMGMSQQAALEATGTFGNFLQAMGQSEEPATAMSKAMVQLAADLGSFNNASPEEVLLALRSGLSGETEPLRKFGVDISDAAVKAELLATGVQKVGKDFTQAQKIQGRYNLIMRQTVTAQGDFVRTSGGLANSTKIAEAKMKDLEARIGQGLIPIMLELNKAAVLVLDGLDALGDLGANGPNELAASYLAAAAAGDHWIEMERTLGLALGMSADQMNTELNARLDANKSLTEAQAVAQIYTEFLEHRFIPGHKEVITALVATGNATGVMTGTIESALARVPPAVQSSFDALVGIVKGSLKSAVRETKARMADITWSLKHPTADADLEAIYESAIKKGTRAMNRALKSGNESAYAKAKKFVDDTKAKLSELEKQTYDIDVIFNAAFNAKYKRYGNGVTHTGDRARASGGPVSGGQTYLVGERGPELLRMGAGQSGHVTSNKDMGGGGGWGSPITINIGIAGDPVSTGRELDRVLSMYYRRSGQLRAR